MTSTSGQSTPPALHLSGVSFAFPGGVSLKVRDFRVEGGQRVLITGASGQGKTTLLHLLAGLLRPDSGRVEVAGAVVNELSESARCRLRREQFGLIFQNLNLLAHLTSEENVRLGLSQRYGAKELALAALRRVGMDKYASTQVATLSLGQQQRVAVARVLAAKPKLILADEPTSSLDAANAEAVLQALLDAAKTATMVMVSHDLRVRAAFDRVYPIAEVLAP